MITLLAENIGTMITALILVVVLIFIVIKMAKDKKAGKGCAGCPYGGSCGCGRECGHSDGCFGDKGDSYKNHRR